jgi:hypothetical protein
MVVNGDATTVNVDEFLKLLVGRRRLQRYYDPKSRVCTLIDPDSHQRFCIDLVVLQRLSTR